MHFPHAKRFISKDWFGKIQCHDIVLIGFEFKAKINLN